MKISVITLHNIKNYGSALQTYATQKILRSYATEVEIINYYRKNALEENIVQSRMKKSKIFSKNFLTKIVGKILIGQSVKKQCKVFNKFLKENINLTKKYSSYEELRDDYPEADIYCTGSDQVWNSDWNEGIDKAFFLDFVPDNKKRIAYAASFGKEKLDDFEIEETRKLLEKYSAISVREDSAVQIVKDLGINNVVQVIDPTLMLTKEEWKGLVQDIKQKNKYILVYQLNTKNPSFDKYVKELSKRKKMPVVRISNTIYQKIKYGKFIYCPTIEQFLSYFANAEYVVTDSFHGTGFSINFNKKFVCIFPQKFSSRLQSILNLTGLEERQVKDFKNFDLIDKNIDYERVNKIIQGEREKAKRFLYNAIKGENND